MSFILKRWRLRVVALAGGFNQRQALIEHHFPYKPYHPQMRRLPSMTDGDGIYMGTPATIRPRIPAFA